MKKLQFLVCFLLLSVASYAADRTIQLPKPDMTANESVIRTSFYS